MRGFTAPIIGCFLLLVSAGSGSGQYIFLDVNGDAVCNSLDRLNAGGRTSVDIWLQTDRNRDGSRAPCLARSSIPASIFSYEFILHASGGTVEWGPYLNLLPFTDFCSGEYRSDTDFYAGYDAPRPLPPGKYKLGTLVVRVASGNPHLGFVSQAPPWYWAHTSFGSMNPGTNGANTFIYTGDRTESGDPNRDIGVAWTDADGIDVADAALAAPKGPGAAIQYRFEVSVSPNPLNPGAAFVVSTTRPGFLRVRLYDVGGRLVRTLLDLESTEEGPHRVWVASSGDARDRLASGVYFYRVEAEEGALSGRLVIAK